MASSSDDAGTDEGTGEEQSERVGTATEIPPSGDRPNQLELALRGLRAGIWEWRPQTGAMTADERTRELFGITRPDVTLEVVRKGVHPGDLARFEAHIELALAPSSDGSYSIEHRVVGVDRPLSRWVAAQGRCYFDEMGKPTRVIGTLIDITDRKAAERERDVLADRLRHAQKMEAVGRLAGGVAHDFNNLLSIILSHSSTLAEDLPADDPIRADVLDIRAAGVRAMELTRQLLAFGRQQLLAPAVSDLNEIVQNLSGMVRRTIGEDIALEARLAPDLKLTFVDPGQIEQVVMNLVLNARDAMPLGGVLTIETRNVVVDAVHARAAEIKHGDYVLLSVEDDGTGIAVSTQPGIFEPYFTTKEHGRGTGLGLATVFGVVTQSGGYVHVVSTPGAGARFEIHLPVTAATKVARRPSRPMLQALGGAESVLLAEDDEGVRKIAGMVLRRAGYRVTDAASGEEALRLCLARETPFDLLLTDVVMRGMGGRELAERVASARPATKVLFMSGHTDDAVLRHGVTEGIAFLQKPLTPEKLLGAVRSVLGPIDSRAQ